MCILFNGENLRALDLRALSVFETPPDVFCGLTAGMYWTIPGGHVTHFFKVLFLKIQIWCEICIAVIQLLVIRSQQIFAHAMTAQLSCHEQNFVAITLLESGWEQKWNFYQMSNCNGKPLVKSAPGTPATYDLWAHNWKDF